MAERTAQILQLRSDGLTLDQIASACGMSKRRVWRIVRRAETFALIEELFDDSLESIEA